MFLLKKLTRLLLSSNDDKRIQSLNLIETYVYGTRKELICKKGKIKQLCIIKTIPEFLTVVMSQMKAQKNINQNGQEFLTILIKY